MKSQAVIYSPANLDSCLASAIVQSNAKKLGEEIKVFAYNRGSDTFKVPTDCDSISIVGADLSPDVMMELFESNKDATVYNNYTYQNSTKYPVRLLSKFISDSRYIEHSFEATDDFKICVSSRVLSADQDDSIAYDKNKPTLDNSVVKDYAGIVAAYIDFSVMTAAETLFLFSNISNVRKAAAGLEPLDLCNVSSAARIQQYDEYVQDTRQLVKANMAMAYYAGANGSGMHTPTVCVGERDAMLAMRFINYAYDDVISHEDTRSARIYRVLSTNNLQWYIKRFEPRDIWSEGSLTYFKTELPQHVR